MLFISSFKCSKLQKQTKSEEKYDEWFKSKVKIKIDIKADRNNISNFIGTEFKSYHLYSRVQIRFGRVCFLSNHLRPIYIFPLYIYLITRSDCYYFYSIVDTYKIDFLKYCPSSYTRLFKYLRLKLQNNCQILESICDGYILPWWKNFELRDVQFEQFDPLLDIKLLL